MSATVWYYNKKNKIFVVTGNQIWVSKTKMLTVTDWTGNPFPLIKGQNLLEKTLVHRLDAEYLGEL